MKTIDLYKYTREDGGITVSPVKPEDTEYATLSRLIADDGMELVNGETRTVCVDTDVPDEWTEEPYEEPTNTKEDTYVSSY